MADRDLLDYYLGPTGIPDRLRALGELDPVQGIMRGMSASGRAADSDLPPEQRRAAAGEAAMETGIALLPGVFGRLLGRTVRGSRAVAPGYTPEEIATIETFVGGAPDAPPTDLAPPPAPTDLAPPPATIEVGVLPDQGRFDFDTERLLGDALRFRGEDFENLSDEASQQLFDTQMRLDTGQFDDVLTEDELRTNFRRLMQEDITGELSPDNLHMMGLPEEEVAAIRARFEDLETRFPDIVDEEMSFLDEAFDNEQGDNFFDLDWNQDLDFLSNLEVDEDTGFLLQSAASVLPDTAPAFNHPAANPYSAFPEESANTVNPLSWRNEGIAGLYSRSAKAARDLRQPAYGDINQLRKELEARGAPPKELDLQMRSLGYLFEDSPTGKVSASEVQEALDSAPGLRIQRTEKFAEYSPFGGRNHTSTVYTHPSVQAGPEIAYRHFGQGPDNPPPLFHSRAAQYDITPDGTPASTHHVLEIQSDWAQHRQNYPSTPESRAQMEDESRRLLDDMGRSGLTAEQMNRFDLLEGVLETNMYRSDFDAQFPAPLLKNENDWVDAGVRQNLIDAVNAGSDWITFGNGRQANRHVYMPLEAAKRFYDKQVPASVERVLRKLSREANAEFPELQDVPFVDGDTVKGLRITPELREAIINVGLPSFKDGGLIQTPSGTRRGTVLPATWPEGMSGGEALMSGQAELALPGMIADPVNSIAESFMTFDRLLRGESLPKGQVESAGMTLAAVPMSPAALARPRPNTLFANPPSGGRKVQGRFAEGSTLSRQATANIRAPEEGSMTGATKRQMEDLASRKAAPQAGEGKRAELSEAPVDLRLVRAPLGGQKIRGSSGTPQAIYDPVTGEARAAPQRRPGDVTRMAADSVAGDPGHEWLEVPKATMDRLNLSPQNFTDERSRLAPDGRTVYLASGPDTARFLQAWRQQAEFFGLPASPNLLKPRALPNSSIFTYPKAGQKGKSFDDMKQEARGATVRSQGPTPKSKFFD